MCARNAICEAPVMLIFNLLRRKLMNSKLAAILTGLILLITSPAWGTTLTWNFDSPAGNLGNSHTYTVSGVSVTATGFSAAGVSNETALFGKTEGGDESGLGIAAEDDHEIAGSEFIQFDISDVANLTSGSIVMGSVQSGETFEIFGSNTLGDIGTMLASGGSTYNSVQFMLPASFANYKYLGVKAGNDDVLVQSLTLNTSSVPEPATFWLFGSALLLGPLMLRRLRSQEV
jgi:hypothetical protein